MRDERLEVSVSFDPRRGYYTVGKELRAPVVALSLGGLRRRIEGALLPDHPMIVLQLDALAERERHRRQALATASSAGTLSPASVQPPDKAQALRSVQYA